MKIQSIQLPKIVKALAVATPLLMASPAIKAQSLEGVSEDVFIRSEEISDDVKIPEEMLMSPELSVGGETVYPAIVVSLSEGRLYYYDYDTYLYDFYPIASGKTSTTTKPGLRLINNIEKYPYSDAPKDTKRYKNPDDYGTYILNLSVVDPETGNITGNNGQYIHGTFNPNSIGKKVSKGCIRVHNDVIEHLAYVLEEGQYVLIKE